MENSAEALKLAFSILVFVVAISTTFSVISQAKSTADMYTFFADETSYYEYYDTTNQTVNFDTVVATIYNYYKESISITIKDKDDNIIAIFDSDKEKNTPWKSNNESIIERIKKTIDSNDGESYFAHNTDSYVESFVYEYTNESGSTEIDQGNVKQGILTANSSGIYYYAVKPLKNFKNKSFEISFKEENNGGEYNTPSDYSTVDDSTFVIPNDGSTIQITPGGKKVYITFKATN